MLTAQDAGKSTTAAEKTSRRNGETRRAAGRRNGPSASGARYFLVAGGERLALGEELASEHEALVEALKQNVPFVIVSEWRTKVESGRGGPVIRKEAAVTRKP